MSACPIQEPVAENPVRLRGLVLGSGLRWLELAGASVVELVQGKGVTSRLRRSLFLVLFLPLSLLHWCVSWIGLALDECLYRSARRCPLGRPTLVTGPPRSGTTHLHRVLAMHSRFSTSPTWEVFLAPSIVQKKLLRAWARLDSRVGHPLMRWIRMIERRLFSGFDATHPSSLTEPEEDYFYLSALTACSGWLLAFPRSKRLRAFLPGSAEDNPDQRRTALEFYRYCLQKQRFLAPEGTELLSKNASFTSWLDLFPSVIPEAQLVLSLRDPVQAVPSMLSTARKAMNEVGLSLEAGDMQTTLLQAMQAHYREANRVLLSGSPACLRVDMTALQTDLEGTVRNILSERHWEPDTGFEQFLQKETESSRVFKSSHAYQLAGFGLEAETIRQMFPLPDPPHVIGKKKP
jgi:hypothetical protein